MRKALTIILAVSLISFTGMSFANDTNTGVIGGSGNIGQDNQSQNMGQGQGQQINMDDHSTNTSEAMDRGFPIPGNVGYGPVINYYGKPLPTAQFRPVESLLMYANIFSEGALEQIVARGTDFIHELEIVRQPSQQVRASYEKGEVRWIKIIATTEMQADHGLIGYSTAEADDRKTSMLEVVAQAALDALREGADVLQIVAQGASRDTVTSGWGIGFNTTAASDLGNGDGTMGVATGGMGFSKAWAGMRDKPWIQANALKSPTKIVGKLAVKAAPAPAPKAEVKAAPAKKAEVKAAPVKKAAPAVQTGNHKSSS